MCSRQARITISLPPDFVNTFLKKFGKGKFFRLFGRCRRSVAESGEKLGVYKWGKVCYNLYTMQKISAVFWLFRRAASLCGDIKPAGAAGRYSTIQHTVIRGERSDALPAMQGRRDIGPPLFCCAHFTGAFSGAYYALLCTFFAPIKPCYVPIFTVKKE